MECDLHGDPMRTQASSNSHLGHPEYDIIHIYQGNDFPYISHHDVVGHRGHPCEIRQLYIILYIPPKL